MKCEQVKELMGPYLYGDLTPDEMRQVRMHADDCTDCRADLESQRRVVAALPAEAPHLEDSDRQRIAWAVRGAVRQSEISRSTLGWRLLPLVGAAALVLALFVGNKMGAKPVKPTPVAVRKTSNTQPPPRVMVKIREEPVKIAQKDKNVRGKDSRQELDDVKMTDTLTRAFEKAFARGAGVAVHRSRPPENKHEGEAASEKPAEQVITPESSQPAPDGSNIKLPEPTKPNDARTSTPDQNQ